MLRGFQHNKYGLISNLGCLEAAGRIESRPVLYVRHQDELFSGCTKSSSKGPSQLDREMPSGRGGWVHGETRIVQLFRSGRWTPCFYNSGTLES